MAAYLSLVGKKFNRLLILGLRRIESKSYFLCHCDCGREGLKNASNVIAGKTKSCGCLRVEFGKSNRAHGGREGGKSSPEYEAWSGAKDRCYNKKDRVFKHYGGRGISVCDRWLHSYQNFLADMGRRPNGTSLDRIDVNGNYEPGNCRWATKAQQARNTRRTTLTEEKAALIRRLVARGLSKAEVSRRTGINYSSVKQVASGRQWA